MLIKCYTTSLVLVRYIHILICDFAIRKREDSVGEIVYPSYYRPLNKYELVSDQKPFACTTPDFTNVFYLSFKSV